MPPILLHGASISLDRYYLLINISALKRCVGTTACLNTNKHITAALSNICSPRH